MRECEINFIQFWVDFAMHWIVQSHQCCYRIYRCWCFVRVSPLVRIMPFSPCADVVIERQIDSRARESAPQFYLYPSHCCRRNRDPYRATSNRLWPVSIWLDDFGTRFLPVIWRDCNLVDELLYNFFISEILWEYAVNAFYYLNFTELQTGSNLTALC